MNKKTQRRIIVLGILGILICVSPGEGRAVDMQSIVRGNSAFAWNLYAQLRKEEGNLFFSPYSISMALAMTYAGARGQTAEQMAGTLHFPGQQAEFHPAVAELAAHIEQLGQIDDIKLHIANSLWPDSTLQPLDSFLHITDTYYHARPFPVDFFNETEPSRQKINEWVADNTMQKIQELLQQGDITPDTVLVLVNAIYFKGNWFAPFKEEQTQEAAFASPDGEVMVPMMQQRGDFDYAEDEGLQVMAFPYAGKSLYMLVFLPQQTDDLGRLESSLNSEFVARWFRNLESKKVMVAFPKFSIRSHFSLLGTLKALGMRNLSDFSGMALPPPFLSKVIHEAYVDVNEQGTEAAAATAVVMNRSLPRYVDFTADHPFVFCILDASSESVLFVGRVMDPTK
jgi:serpin B